MADITADQADAQAAAEGTVRKHRISGKVLVLFIVLPLLLVGGLGAAGAGYFLGWFGSGDEAAEAAKPVAPRAVVFHDLPEMLVNLQSTGRQASYLKIRVSLELDDAEAVKRVDQVMPRVLDNFQVYLRELRPDELHGSAGVQRLKEELLIRVNAAVAPARVNDVLFKEMLLQ
ncbi:MAG: flagellar basal body-associated FliL family protein [Alphaproteobacteria bacterium]|nr:flagellar basal body-associated FliL family protein [Alphaproteobacteria bacterium]